MRLLAVVSAFFLAVFFTAAADTFGSDKATWKPMGDTSIVITGMHPTIAFDSDNDLMLAFSDSGREGRATVLSYKKGKWLIIGDRAFTEGGVTEPVLRANAAGIPYLAFIDHANGQKTSVYAFGATAWKPVGVKGFSKGAAGNITVAFDRRSTPHVAFHDTDNEYRVTVMRYDTAWRTVGDPPSKGNAYTPSLAFTKDNIPLIAFRDDTESSGITVMQYVNTWMPLGRSNCSGAMAQFTSIAAAGDTIIAGFQDWTGMSGKLSIMQWKDGWTFSAKGISEMFAEDVIVRIGPKGIPCAVFREAKQGGKDMRITMAWFDGTWRVMPVAVASASYVYFDIDRNGVPHVVYCDLETMRITTLAYR
ncbi:MAG: hypothetical protein AABZ39_08405 [Spirochaetota bacterium]